MMDCPKIVLLVDNESISFSLLQISELMEALGPLQYIGSISDEEKINYTRKDRYPIAKVLFFEYSFNDFCLKTRFINYHKSKIFFELELPVSPLPEKRSTVVAPQISGASEVMLRPLLLPEPSFTTTSQQSQASVRTIQSSRLPEPSSTTILQQSQASVRTIQSSRLPEPFFTTTSQQSQATAKTIQSSRFPEPSSTTILQQFQGAPASSQQFPATEAASQQFQGASSSSSQFSRASASSSQFSRASAASQQFQGAPASSSQFSRASASSQQFPGALAASLQFPATEAASSPHFPGTPASSPHFPGTPASSPHFPGTPASSPHFSGTPAASQHFPGTPAASQHFPGTPAASQQFQGTPAASQQFQGAPALSPHFPGTPAASQQFPATEAASQHFPGTPASSPHFPGTHETHLSEALAGTEIKFKYSYEFLSICFNKHKSSTYSSYLSLKKEMELYDNMLKYESLEDFIDACKCSFAQFRAFEKIVSGTKVDLLMDKVFNDAFIMMNTNKSSYKILMNKVLCGPLKFTSPWANSEIKHFLRVLKEGTARCKFFRSDGSINRVLVSLFIPGRCGQSCYDQYTRIKGRGIDAEYGVDLKKITNIMHHFNHILQKTFTPDQKEMLIQKIKKGWTTKNW